MPVFIEFKYKMAMSPESRLGNDRPNIFFFFSNSSAALGFGVSSIAEVVVVVHEAQLFIACTSIHIKVGAKWHFIYLI